MLRESGGEFGVGNVSQDVGNVTFNRVVRGESGGFSRTGRSELGKTGVVSRWGGGIRDGCTNDISTCAGR